MFRAASTECMDAELRAVPFALKVCRCVAGEEYRSESANTPAKPYSEDRHRDCHAPTGLAIVT